MDKAMQEFVQRSSLFKDITPETLSLVLASCVTRSVEEDGYFFIQGDASTHAYVLVEGRVKMYQIAPNGNQITIRILTPGQTFGGIALIDPNSVYPITAQAVTDSAALAWDAGQLMQRLNHTAAITKNVMRLMHGYISELLDREQDLTAHRVEQRIARNLLKLVSQTGIKVDEGLLINLPITRQDIADMSGTTVYTVSRTLSAWERSGILNLGREKVIICDPHRLVSIADDLDARV